MTKSITRVGRIKAVFAYSDDDEKSMRVQIARAAVLYDDLMLEYEGAQADSIPLLDQTGKDSRRFYFVRRTLGTLMELRGAIAVLNRNSSFTSSRSQLADSEQKKWKDAVAFFDGTHKFLKEWRNDVGGHFLDDAAEYAIDNIHPETVGVIEIYRRGDGADIRMKFAYELVAMALIKNRDTKQPEDEFLKGAFTFLLEAIKHSVNAVQIISGRELFERFK